MHDISDILRLAKSGCYTQAFDKLYNLTEKKAGPIEAYYIGIFYLNGYGTERNVDAALYWLEKSADLGNEDAGELLKIINRMDQIQVHFDLFRGFG